MAQLVNLVLAIPTYLRSSLFVDAAIGGVNFSSLDQMDGTHAFTKRGDGEVTFFGPRAAASLRSTAP